MQGLRAAAVAALAVAAATSSLAQQPPRGFADNVSALSEVLGEAHYIRRLCYGRADQRWRDQMKRFMDLEGPPGAPLRKVMSDGFNDGYRSQEERFPECTPEARNYEQMLNTRGARLAAALAARYRD